MNASPDVALINGRELTEEQLDEVDGGAVAIAIASIVATTPLVWWATNRED